MELGFERKTKEYLFSRIEVRARLIGRIGKIREELHAYPSVKLVRDGTSLLYEVAGSNEEDHFYSLEFGKKSITLTVYSRQSPLFFLKEALLRLLGTLQIVSQNYALETRSLCPYLVLALAEKQLDYLQNSEPKEETPQPELALAKRIVGLMRENEKLKEDNYKLSGKLRRTILQAIAHCGRSGSSVEEVAAALNMDKTDITYALSGAREAGYRTIHTGRDTFSLVKV